jgi:hypothetical protein
MKLNNRVIQSLLAIFSVSAILFGMAIAQEYNGSTPSENLALKSSAVSVSVPIASAVLAKSIAPSSYCFKCLPTPRLIYTGKEDYTVSGTAYTRYKLAVANRDDYPASLFKPAPDLPPCGLNTNSARTWVNIYDSSGGYIYGFCALSSPSDLSGLWFAVPKGKAPPKSVYITLNDRRCKVVLKSNLVTIS